MSERRVELIVELLRLSADPTAAAAAWEGVRGTGQAIPIRPHEPRCPLANRNAVGRNCTCWLRSLDELDRARHRLKNTDRPCWYAVEHRYRLCTRKPQDVRLKNGRPQLELNQAAVGLIPSGQKTGQVRLLVETWRPGLNPAFWQRGLVLLADDFQGQPELPLELLHAA